MVGPHRPEPFGITVHLDSGECRVRVSGELDLSTIDELRGRLVELQARHRSVVLDLSRLTFMDSSGLHLILKATAHARLDGWNLRIDPQVSAPVGRLLDLTSARSMLDWN